MTGGVRCTMPFMATTLDPALKKLPIPGPKGHWFKGNLSAFARDRLGFLTSIAREYGDIVAIRFLNKKILVVNHPDLVEEVLVTRNRQFIKHFALRFAKPTLGEGLLTSEGDFWRRQRRLSQPAFHREKVAGHARVMVEFTERMLEGWSGGMKLDVQEAMMRLTLEIVAKCLFDADVSGDSAEASRAMETVLHCFTARVNSAIRVPMFLPTPTNRRLYKAKAQLDRIVYRIIAERRASGEDRGDLLSMLLEATDPVEEGGAGMTDLQLRDEAMTLFMAGHETTANTMAWVFFLLSTHPEVEAKLLAEVDEALPDRAPTFDDLPKLPYAERVIIEALRLYPTVWLVGREAIEPTEVGGHPVAVGTTVYMSQLVLHRDPRFFDDPLAYRPERWEGGLAKKIPRYAYFPFGGGPRICIGNAFAMMEAVLLLATIARRFRVKVVDPEGVVPLPTLTLRPVGGIEVVLEARG